MKHSAERRGQGQKEIQDAVYATLLGCRLIITSCLRHVDYSVIGRNLQRHLRYDLLTKSLRF